MWQVMVHITKVIMGDVQLHVGSGTYRCALSPFCISENCRGCAEIWYVVRDLGPISYAFYRRQWWGTAARAHRFSYLGNGCTACSEVSCMAMGSPVMRFIGITSEAHCTSAPLFHILVTAGRFMKCGVLDTH